MRARLCCTRACVRVRTCVRAPDDGRARPFLLCRVARYVAETIEFQIWHLPRLLRAAGAEVARVDALAQELVRVRESVVKPRLILESCAHLDNSHLDNNSTVASAYTWADDCPCGEGEESGYHKMAGHWHNYRATVDLGLSTERKAPPLLTVYEDVLDDSLECFFDVAKCDHSKHGRPGKSTPTQTHLAARATAAEPRPPLTRHHTHDTQTHTHTHTHTHARARTHTAAALCLLLALLTFRGFAPKSLIFPRCFLLSSSFVRAGRRPTAEVMEGVNAQVVGTNHAFVKF